jgi:hypothetical protein
MDTFLEFFPFRQTEPCHIITPTLSPNLRLFARELALESMLLMSVHVAQTTGTIALDGYEKLSSWLKGYPLHTIGSHYITPATLSLGDQHSGSYRQALKEMHEKE